MRTDRRELISESLGRLAGSYRATMEQLERTLDLLHEELALDPGVGIGPLAGAAGGPGPVVDPSLFTVGFRGRTCFLGNTLDYRLLAKLARRPNRYFSYDVLLADVWGGGIRSDEAVRSVAKRLRSRLRAAGLADLADTIDGSVRGHYALKLAG